MYEAGLFRYWCTVFPRSAEKAYTDTGTVKYRYIVVCKERRRRTAPTPGEKVCLPNLIAFEAASKAGVACRDAIILDRNRDCAPVAQQHHQLFGTRHAGVQQIALEQGVVLGEQWDDHTRIFGA